MLGTYEVVSAIGAGGMGEVYQPHDTKLGRDVAIKVLPEAFAHDPERLARFQREAKMQAALNHPNIATIHGLEQSGGTSYLVMELVAGETLADRVKREGAVPVDEALPIAKQIAEALEAAHEKSIIHRDLKPANVKVTPEGKVKVLDFGLAKAFEGDPSSVDMSNSPTLSMAAKLTSCASPQEDSRRSRSSTSCSSARRPPITTSSTFTIRSAFLLVPPPLSGPCSTPWFSRTPLRDLSTKVRPSPLNSQTLLFRRRSLPIYRRYRSNADAA
jgi:serine/threonine protein kinase